MPAIGPLAGLAIFIFRFLATNLKDIRSGAMGWFPTQNLKINRTTAMYTKKNLFPNNPP